ncbi:FkbM family methyltransferase [Peribacillus frigoritolerans]|uniref:FkbM family methyltransferase n=1 Tax=Peribacillus frigoritolerans TaxID=450367 RepID=UPI00119A6652|nr:FkbM family methyltransferase [Peribacillus frigoritolerans]TWD97782.1 FkbM family methyltransferase [Peribacillus frigoritolerans]
MFKDAFYLGDHTVFKKTLHDTFMFLDPREGVNFGILLFGQWEEWVTRQFIAAIKHGMTVLDIGAHCGYYSMLAGTLVGNEGSVHSFEPLPFFHRNFLKSASVNGCAGRIHLHRVMLSDTKGEAEIRTAGEGGAYYTFHGLDEISDTTTVYKVSKGILSDNLPSLKADVIKIDVDDAAPIVMNTLLPIIDNSGPMTVFMEYEPVFWSGHNDLSMLQSLAHRGFQFHILHRNGHVEPTTPEALVSYNIVQNLDLKLTR